MYYQSKLIQAIVKHPTQWVREDNKARNDSREKEQRKVKTKMGERHQRYVRYDGSSKQSGRGQASISQRHLGSDVLTRIMLSEEE